jgi:hypothetical protein
MKNHVFSLLAALLLALPTVASAQYNSLFDSPTYNTQPSYENKYDWRTGNSYNIRRDSLGNTHILLTAKVISAGWIVAEICGTIIGVQAHTGTQKVQFVQAKVLTESVTKTHPNIVF